MNFYQWLTIVERIKAEDYAEMPIFYQNKIRANYASYIEGIA